VIRALPFSSEVMLITDPNHAISVEVQRNGLRTIAVGSGRYNRLNLPYLPNNSDIVAGDTLITSGLDDTFPQGYPVAIVDQFIKQPNKPFAEISATPIANLDRDREVLITWNNAKRIQLGIENKPQPIPTPTSQTTEPLVIPPLPHPVGTASAPQ
jgi:rod shape-determining protein MreC